MPKSKKPRKKQHYTKVALPTVPQSMIDNVKDHIRLIGFAVEVKLPLSRFDVTDVHELNEFINWTGYTAYKLQHDRSRWTREQADEVISTQIQVSEALKSPKCEALLPAIRQAYKPSPEDLEKITADVAAALRKDMQA